MIDADEDFVRSEARFVRHGAAVGDVESEVVNGRAIRRQCSISHKAEKVPRLRWAKSGAKYM